MKLKLTITSRIILFIASLLFILILLYVYANRVSVYVIEKELKASNFNRFSFFVNQMEQNMDQISINAFTLSKDPSVLELGNRYSKLISQADQIIRKKDIMDKIQLQMGANNWSNQVLIYYTYSKQFLGTMSYVYNDIDDIKNNYTDTWKYRERQISGYKESTFIKFISVPHSVNKSVNKDFKNTNTIFEISFSTDNLKKMLNDFKIDEKGDPFLYHSDFDPITTYNANIKLIQKVDNVLYKKSLNFSGNFILELNSKKYLINYQKSNNLGWYLIDYMPIQDILSPIKNNEILFNITIVLSFILVLLVWIKLYRQIQVPINTLIIGFKKVKERDFSVRIEKKLNSEFGVLFLAFNDMAIEIEDLIEKVYSEKIRAQQATLKQLQAQINPHFLYNCLAYIMSMAKLKEYDSIVAMSYNLGKYYRYTTRLECQTVNLKEEIQLVSNYLEIQNLRMERLEYEVILPETMENLQIPRLIIQPIVENAVVHGIETKKGMGYIKIICKEDINKYSIIIKDNGMGISDGDLKNLNQKIREPINDKTGFGTWNVYNRLILYYGESADLTFYSDHCDGVQAILTWGKTKQIL